MDGHVRPDRGYAWVVLAASVGSFYVSGVLVYFVGVIHVELLDRFQENVTLTAWAGSIYSSLQMLAAPLASWVVNRYSCRVSVVAGGIMLCVGFLTSAFATSVGQLVVTYGLIAGLGLGLNYSPSLMVVTFYFSKFRGLASGISVAGAGVGILTGSVLTQAFIDLYTLRGAFLIIAGLGLQTCVFGMLFRPTQHDGSGKRLARQLRERNQLELSWELCIEDLTDSTRATDGEKRHGKPGSPQEDESWLPGSESSEARRGEDGDWSEKVPNEDVESVASSLEEDSDPLLQEVVACNGDHGLKEGSVEGRTPSDQLAESGDTSSVAPSQTTMTSVIVDVKRDHGEEENEQEEKEEDKKEEEEKDEEEEEDGEKEKGPYTATQLLNDLQNHNKQEEKEEPPSKTATTATTATTTPPHRVDSKEEEEEEEDASEKRRWEGDSEEKKKKSACTKGGELDLEKTRSGEEDSPQYNEKKKTRSGEEDSPQYNGKKTRSGEEDSPQYNGNKTRSGEEDIPQDNGNKTRSGEEDSPQDNGKKTRPGEEDIPQDKNSERPTSSWCPKLNLNFNLNLRALVPVLKNPAFLLHCGSILLADITMGGVYLHLPEYARQHGTTRRQGAALFVAVGVFSLLSRVGSGLLLTSPRVSGLLLSVVLMATCGLACCLFPLYSASYVGQMVFSSLYGLSTGGFYTLINVLTVDLVDFHLLPTAYGVFIFAMGVGYLAGPPLAALIVDSGGTYEHSFIFLGLAMFASAAFDLLAKVVHTRSKRKREKAAAVVNR